MASGVLLGILSSLGNLGQQQGEASQINAEEKRRNQDSALRLLSAQSESKARQTQQQEAQQRIENERQRLKLAQRPTMVGNPFVSGGKTYARFQSPVDGSLSVQELPGGAPETPDEAKARGLKALNFSDADIQQIIKRGKSTAEKQVVQPDAKSKTGYSTVYYDQDGTEVWRADSLPPRGLIPATTSGTSVDQFGNVTSHTSTRTPLIPGTATPPAPRSTSGGIQAPPIAPKSQGGAVAPQGGSPVINVGTYKGVTTDGNIPEDAKVNPQIREYANDILQGRDVTKIPAKARPLAESVARAYGWKGQGSLTPAQQMQIEQVDNSLKSISDPKLLKVFDGPGSLFMSTVPMDPTGEGGTGGLVAGLKRKAMTDQQAEYMNALTRLRGVIGGIRGFTGANNSNATADRLLAELPNFTNTKNSADALNKINKLRQEVAIIKRLGYFQPDTSGPQVGDKVTF